MRNVWADVFGHLDVGSSDRIVEETLVIDGIQETTEAHASYFLELSGLFGTSNITSAVFLFILLYGVNAIAS